MTTSTTPNIKPGYGTRAVFGRAALETNWSDDVSVGMLYELGGDLDLPREECSRIIANARAGRLDPWHH